MSEPVLARPREASLPPPPPPPHRAGGFLAWFPWEKVLIWGFFLLAVYALRHFFFTIFMTFMITYIMRNVVRSVTRIISPRTERVWVQRVVSAIAFVLLIGVLTGVGFVLYQPLKEQAQKLYGRINVVNFETTFNDFLRDTIGAWRYRARYGLDPSKNPEYLADLQEYKETQHPAQAFEEFQEKANQFDSAFRGYFTGELGERRYQDLVRSGKEPAEFLAWTVKNIDDESYQKARPDLLGDWQQNEEILWKARHFPDLPPEEVKKRPEYEKAREEYAKDRFLKNELHDRRDYYLARFKEGLGREEFARLASTSGLDERRRKFYDDWKNKPTYSYDRFQELSAAARTGKDAFQAKLAGDKEPQPPESLDQDARENKLRDDFRRWKETQLFRDTVDKDLQFLQIVNVKTWLKERVPEITKWIANLGLELVNLLIQLGFSLLLSFFITFDLYRLRRGIQKLEQGAVRDFYHEIAPGLISFGRLIGRSFQAQGVIAVCNTILTFSAIKILGIENELFLSAIVFLCSFIPVLGVVISSVPISIMAIIQTPGTGLIHDPFLLALAAIGAVLVVHFIETSILNPKILGDMLHLHPVAVLGILAVGEYFFGVWGLLLGVPVAVYIFRSVILREQIDLGP